MSENFYNGDTESGDVFGQLNPRLQRIGQDLGFFGILSILYGAFGSFCPHWSACFTANMTVGYRMNRLALVLLFCIFILHQCHSDANWDIGKYMVSICLYLIQALEMVFYPLRHLYGYILSLKDRRCMTVFYLLGGVLAAIPAVIFLCMLLAGADIVFSNMLRWSACAGTRL